MARHAELCLVGWPFHSQVLLPSLGNILEKGMECILLALNKLYNPWPIWRHRLWKRAWFSSRTISNIRYMPGQLFPFNNVYWPNKHFIKYSNRQFCSEAEFPYHCFLKPSYCCGEIWPLTLWFWIAGSCFCRALPSGSSRQLLTLAKMHFL